MSMRSLASNGGRSARIDHLTLHVTDHRIHWDADMLNPMLDYRCPDTAGRLMMGTAMQILMVKSGGVSKW